MNIETSLELAVDVFAGMPSIASVRQLEDVLRDFPPVDLGTRNLVHGGMCARTGMIPAGAMLTGALTNIDNVCVCFGDITVTTDDGPKHLVGFHVLPAKAGAKRAGLANADTWWTTIHRTDLTDIEAIENEMTNESHLLLTRSKSLGCAGQQQLEGV